MSQAQGSEANKFPVKSDNLGFETQIITAQNLDSLGVTAL